MQKTYTGFDVLYLVDIAMHTIEIKNFESFHQTEKRPG